MHNRIVEWGFRVRVNAGTIWEEPRNACIAW